MGRLKKLALSKRYLNITRKDNFLELVKKEINELEIKDVTEKEVLFYSNHLIKDNSIEVLDRYKYYGKYFISKHLVGICTLIVIIILLLVSGNFIRQVEFRNSNDYNEEIYQDVMKHVVKRGPFYSLNISLNELSTMIRNNYPEYAFIGLSKEGSRLLIDVDYQDVPKREETNLNVKGDYVAKCDAVIEDIIVKRGVIMIQNNQSVKAGEILISGNLNILNDPNNFSNLVRSEGIIIGKTLCLEKIAVLKEDEKLGLTGNIKVRKVVSLFGKSLGKNSVDFDTYYTTIRTVFKFLNILDIKEITYYEQDIIKSVYNENMAKRFAESVIYKEFEKQRVSDLEKIIDLDIIDITEDDEFYIVSIIVTKKQNIAVFKQY